MGSGSVGGGGAVAVSAAGVCDRAGSAASRLPPPSPRSWFLGAGAAPSGQGSPELRSTKWCCPRAPDGRAPERPGPVSLPGHCPPASACDASARSAITASRSLCGAGAAGSLVAAASRCG